MDTVRVKNIVIGEGIPKICASIIEKNKKLILKEAVNISKLQVDIVEWRVDWFEDAEDIEKVKDVLKDLVPILKDTPLLFTFRTSKEGGEKDINVNKYVELNKAIVTTGVVDIIDVEVFIGDEVVKDIINYAHGMGAKVIASNHDFYKTPSKDDIIYRLRKMQDLGADILKIAVMPNNVSDVITLLDATRIMKEKYANRPIITMSMSGKGVVSRLTGELFGSALTFGATNKISAPGQISIADLRKVIELLHENM